jgi:hypothetical protein
MWGVNEAEDQGVPGGPVREGGAVAIEAGGEVGRRAQGGEALHVAWAGGVHVDL